MFLLAKPSERDIRAFQAAQSELAYSYKDVGLTKNLTSAPAGFVLDHNRVKIGSGEIAFRRTVDALKKWRQFDLGWMNVCTPDTAISPNASVCLLVPFRPVWLLIACRIVYVIDEVTVDGVTKFGFGYGTLPGHPEAGEERFSIEWRGEDDSVWYDILAFSRPGTLLVRTGYPFARQMQKRFARDSMKAMATLSTKDR